MDDRCLPSSEKNIGERVIDDDRDRVPVRQGHAEIAKRIYWQIDASSDKVFFDSKRARGWRLIYI